jgi:hypothetical protein
MTSKPFYLNDAFQRLRAAVDADEHVPMEQVIEVVLDRLAHAEDVQNGDDAASRVAERVMREVRKEFEAVLDAREAEHQRQKANKEKRHAEEKQHLRDQLHDALAEIRHLRDQMHDMIAKPAQSVWQIPASMVPPPPDTFTRQQVEAMLRVALTDRTDEWTIKSVDERVAALLATFTKED